MFYQMHEKLTTEKCQKHTHAKNFAMLTHRKIYAHAEVSREEVKNSLLSIRVEKFIINF